MGDAKFSIRVTTRIVDVSVAAFDKRGQASDRSTRDDFEIADGDRKQSLRSFASCFRCTECAGGSPAPSDQPNDFSNPNRTKMARPKRKLRTPSENTTASSLFDPASLAFNDLISARNQVLRILSKLPPTEAVGLYVSGRDSDSECCWKERPIARFLARHSGAWRPEARDVARGKETDERNRDQFDTLQTPLSVLSTYSGVGGSDGGGSTIGTDPALSNQGVEPTRLALLRSRGRGHPYGRNLRPRRILSGSQATMY